MKLTLLCALHFFAVLTLTACQQTMVNTGGNQWDFDHQLAFQQRQGADNHYHIKVLRNYNTNFSQLAMFLLRQSYRVCGRYGFNLKIQAGIEEFLDNQVAPNLIQGALVAELICPVGKVNS